MNTTNSNLEIANTILRQLGTARVMLGIKSPLATDRGLRFRIGKNPKRVTHVQIDLTPADTYTVTFHRIPRTAGIIAGKKAVVTATETDVYVDQLHTVLEAHTGNYCSL